MDSVLRAVIVYVVLMVLMRVTGKRALGQVTTFDFVLLLIIGESIQQGITANDYSMTNALIIVTTLVTLDIGVSVLKQHSKPIERLMESRPLVLVEEGVMHRERMNRERVDEAEILESARLTQGIESMDKIRYAILETSGSISIIPKQQGA